MHRTFLITSFLFIILAFMVKDEVGIAVRGLYKKYTDESIKDFCRTSYIPTLVIAVGFFARSIDIDVFFLKELGVFLCFAGIVWSLYDTVKYLKRK